jgi:hypothetical protein
MAKATKIIRKRKFGGAPPVDFLDLSYLMPLHSAAAMNGRPDYPFKFSGALKFSAAVTQSAGKLPRWLNYERFVRTLMSTPAEAEDMRAETFAKWVTSLYRGRRYPYIVIGPPLGSLAYLASMLDAPFLPLNFALAIRHDPLNPDDISAHIQLAEKWSKFYQKRDPGIQIVHEYDPVHDRFRIKHGSLLRARFNSLPAAYDEFIATHLSPKGTIMLVESRIGWRQFAMGDNLLHQTGRPGGIPSEEYLMGSSRLNQFLAKFMQGEKRYGIGRPDELQPESRFGVTPSIRLSVISSVDRHNRNLCQLFTDEIYLVNQLISQLFVRCARREGQRPKYCYLHSGSFIAPYICMQTTMLPLWVPTPCFPAFEFVRLYLKLYPYPLEEILIAFEPSIEEAPDFMQLSRWKEGLGEKTKVRFIGMNPRLYPRQVTSFFEYWPALTSWMKKHRRTVDIRVTTDTVVQEAEKCGIHFQVTENAK